jgi:general stress protein CsbA
VAGDEPVTSPDQHKPGPGRAARVGAVLTIIVLLALLCGNHKGRTEDVWLVGVAALLAVVLVVDWVLRRNGLRS